MKQPVNSTINNSGKTGNMRGINNKVTFVSGLRDIDRTKLETAGGKAANLGELCRVEGVQVPQGFCVTAEAYKKITVQ